MSRELTLAMLLLGGAAFTALPAHAAGTAYYAGPHRAGAVTWNGGGYHGGYGYHGYGYHGGGVAAGAVAGLAVGTAVGVAAASHPAYVAPPPVVYAPPPVVYAVPPVAYAPGYYVP